MERGDSLRLDNYTLSVDLTPVVENEDNNISISATPMVAANALANTSAVVKGILGTAATPDANDVDWYSFTTGSQIGTSVTLNITAATTDADVYTVSVYDSSVDEVVRNQSGQPLTTSVGTNAGSLTLISPEIPASAQQALILFPFRRWMPRALPPRVKLGSNIPYRCREPQTLM